METIGFVKGHGTENDFVLLPDMAARLDLTDERVRALCDRRRGLGADGVLRVLPTDRVAELLPDVDVTGSASRWFMDYRNGDGSIAEMCGNGVRVFARYLVTAGLADGSFAVGTRAGDREVTVHPDGTVTVRMGPARVTGRSTATLAGRVLPGVAVDVGNPHLVCAFDQSMVDIAALDLAEAPGHDTAVFPNGVNVEFVNPLAPGTLRMRVHERGVGETRSCGTGTIAVVAAVLHDAGERAGQRTVVVPGGRLTVTVDEHDSTLTGPAVLVATGELSSDWWLDAAK
jgi:diaminopimelate epimerase